MNELGPLVAGDLIAEKPAIQGGMGVGIGLHRLAGAVARASGMGIIPAAQTGLREPDFITSFVGANARSVCRKMRLARGIMPQGAIGSNIMVATKHYDMWVKETVKVGADIIISGAGLPVSLPEYVEAVCAEMKGKSVRRTKLTPIISSAKSAMVICKMWDRRCHTIPDLVVMEGPLAEGHLGFSLDQLPAHGADIADVPATYGWDAYDRKIKVAMKVVEEYEDKYDRRIPVVTAGGIYTHEDVIHRLELDVDGVQVTVRFVTTEECDVSDAYEQAYINAGREDIITTQSPVGMPGGAILNPFLSRIKGDSRPAARSCFQCLERYDIRTIPYCIIMVPVNAVEGGTGHSLLFCGSNTYRAKKIDTVGNVMKGLTGELV